MGGAFLGLDLGGTRIRALLVAPGGRKLAEDSAPSQAREGAERVLVNAQNLASDLAYRSGARIEGACVGAPGAFDGGGRSLIAASNIPGWKGFELGGRMGAALKAPCKVLNDASAAAFGEYAFSGSASRSFALVAIGTGIGCGLVLDGRLFEGSLSLAGELGHLIVEPGGRPCPCGLAGCLERYASGTGIALSLAEGAGSFDSPLARRIKAGGEASSIAAYAEPLDPLALAAHGLACGMLARALGSLVNLLAADEIVFGGGLGASSAPLLEGVAPLLRGHCLGPLAEALRLRRALAPEPGALGAALIAEQLFGNRAGAPGGIRE